MTKILVQGKVQGVAFRYYTKQKANGLSLSGTVQNLADGSVLIFVDGSKELVNQLIEWCSEGSPAAIVSMVNAIPIENHILQDKSGFNIIRC